MLWLLLIGFNLDRKWGNDMLKPDQFGQLLTTTLLLLLDQMFDCLFPKLELIG
jgi:hypothetical protein|uniref:Uncharacterized protein n=1 Tax=Picea glauca TaxID=3330 RepID=A0A101M0G1_PICGL|nr:hypothetical protein ABT39_MTgene4669 [Picea glauca]QHR91271.1 hypothetical protein Q903MT_gene5303 [Picea sitchensis]